MLIQCPECELQVSDKALNCPHCGYPIQNDRPKRPRSSSKRMRLPNGFGQITEVKGKNLRKPFRAMITVGKTDEGKYIRRLLKPESYFETYNDAYYALLEYNKNPYDLDNDMTIQELYDKWSVEYFKTLKSESSTRTIKSAWSHSKTLYKMRAKDLRARHVKGCMDECESPNIKSRIKSMFNLMMDYAVENEIVEKNYIRDFKISQEIRDEIENNKNDHTSFNKEELNLLWDNKTDPLIAIILLQSYTGFRPQELCNIEMKNVDIKNWTIVGGMKTEAGIERTVPICDVIKPVLKNIYSLSSALESKWLCCDRDGSYMSYDKYQKKFNKLMKELDMDHRPHDPRKTFITMCKNSGLDEYAIKKIVGHKISDITEAIYTDRDPNWIFNEVKKIKGL